MERICVLGLGYVGLPTAAMLATHGHEVLGVDVSRQVLDRLHNGEVHIHEAGLRSLVRAALKSGHLRIAEGPEPADAFIIAVPTPIVREEQALAEGAPQGSPVADLSYVISAAEAIVPHLQPGNLVILESTVPPRTTEDVVAPILRRSGVRDLLVAHCPERVLPGRILAELVGNSRVIGGVDQRSAEAARELYASFVEGEMLLTDATTAELVKLMENTHRDVNIALANEFALVAERVGVDVWEAIDLANRHPRVKMLRPGPGVGGHCIAVDPWFVVQAAPDLTPLIQTARRVNDGMPAHVVELVRQAVAGVERPVIACLGLTYKADVDDVRESPALRVLELLKAEGFEVLACDPHVRALPEAYGRLLPVSEALRRADCAVILTDHAEFRALSPEDLRLMRRPLVIDSRCALKGRLGTPDAEHRLLGSGR